jgi:hypothetical protein
MAAFPGKFLCYRVLTGQGHEMICTFVTVWGSGAALANPTAFSYWNDT